MMLFLCILCSIVLRVRNKGDDSIRKHQTTLSCHLICLGFMCGISSYFDSTILLFSRKTLEGLV